MISLDEKIVDEFADEIYAAICEDSAVSDKQGTEILARQNILKLKLNI